MKLSKLKKIGGDFMRDSGFEDIQIEEERLMAAILIGVYAGINYSKIEDDDIDHSVDSIANLYKYWELVKDMEIPYEMDGSVDTEEWRESVWCALKDKFDL